MKGARCDTGGVEIRWFPVTWRRGVTTTSVKEPVPRALDDQLGIETLPYTHLSTVRVGKADAH